jgi:3'(2'), 5'-bisphosphate nucleotidase
MATAADHTLAREVAQLAGELLVALREEHAGLPTDQLRAAGDRRAHLRILELLTDARPTDAVLSEEGYDDRARLGNERVWVVDPLDGTREFGLLGRSDWAVHIALAEAGMVTVGAVALPAEGIVFGTDQPPVVPPVGDRRLRVVTSRTRLPPVAAAVADALDADLMGMGSAGAKAMAVVRGDADVYAHAGGMYEWDSAAPVAVAGAAGLHVSRIDGSPLRYNREHPWLPDLLICRPELAERCLEAVSDVWW